jgi:AraC-like DNA-binding protein
MKLIETVRHLLGSRIFRKYIVSYLIITIFLMIFITTAVYSVSSSALSSYIFDAQMSAAKQARRAFDYEARRYKTIGIMLFNEKNVQSVIVIDPNAMTPKHALNMMRIRALITSSQNGTKESTAHMQLYLQQSGYIIDGSRALPVQDVYKDSSENEYSTRISILNERYSAKWLRFETAESMNCVYFLMTINTSSNNSTGTFMVEMRSSYIESILQPLFTAGDEWTAVYGGEMIYQSGQMPVELDWNQMKENEGQFIKDNHMVSYVRSDVTDDLFVNIVSESKLLAPLRSIRKLIYALLLICFIVCGVLSYLLALHNFNPLRKLVALTSGIRSGGDEYSVLHQKLIEAADEKRRLLDRASMDKQLKNEYDVYKKLMELDRWDDYALGASGYYCVAQISLVDYTENCAPAEAMQLIREVFDFEPHLHWRTKAYQRSSELMILIHFNQANQITLNELINNLKAAVQCVRDNYAADCMVGISTVREPKDPPRVLIHEMEMEARSALQRLDSGESIRVYQANNDLENVFKHFMAEITGSSNIEQALDSFCTEVHRLLDKDKDEEIENSEFRIKQQVIEIVQKQYSNPDLNVSQIASMLGYSADYVSKVFKHTTLIGMLDYIHHTRIAVAKQMLLENRDTRIIEISEAVGYISIDSFHRAFKRIMGTTPGKYRENVITTENEAIQ